MENASKALIMAGGMLIAVIIMSIGVYLFSVFGGTSQNIQKQIDSRVLSEFNNTFIKYEGNTNCTMHDIVSLAGYAKKNNEDFDKTSQYYVSVYVIGVSGINQRTDLSTLSEETYNTLLSNNSVVNANTSKAEIQYYTCTKIEYNNIEYSPTDIQQRVKSITFKKNN